MLFVTNRLDIGGIETNLCRLTAAFTERGHEVTVAAQQGELTKQVQTVGGRTLNLHLVPSNPLQVVRDLALLRRLAAGDIDVIHVFAAKAAMFLWVSLVATRSSQRPRVVASLMGIQGSPTESAWKTKLRAWATILKADTVVVTSPAIRDLINRLHHKPRRTVEASVVGVEVPGSPSDERVSSLRQSLGLTESDRVVLTIGRLDSTKSHDLFINSAALVASKTPNVQFFIVGDGSLKLKLNSLIDSLNLTECVHLMGGRNDVTELLSIADVYVRPGIVEGFVGITVLEAQAQSIPVVSFDTRDVRPAITDTVSGFLVSPSDVLELSEAIIRLLADPDMANRVGDAGHDQFRETYRLDHIVTGLIEIYASTIRPDKY